MRRFLICTAIFQFTLSVAIAQSLPTSPAIRPVLLDVTNFSGKTEKPVVRLEVLSAPQTIVVLPFVALQLLLTGLIGDATSESGIASVYGGGELQAVRKQ